MGIQQCGLESAVPDAVRQAQMDQMAIFMDPDERVQVLSAYALVDPKSDNIAEVVESYPILASEPIYIQRC